MAKSLSNRATGMVLSRILRERPMTLSMTTGWILCTISRSPATELRSGDVPIPCQVISFVLNLAMLAQRAAC